METLPVGLSEMTDSTAVRWFSVPAREMSTLTRTWSEEPIGAEEEQQILSGKFVKSDPEEMEYHWLRSGSGS